MIEWIKQLLNKLGEALVLGLVRGAIIRAGGDDDKLDVIDHETGKPKDNPPVI